MELLLEHHDFVFGVSRTAPDRRATNDANDANDDARSGDKENVSVVAKVEGKSKSSAPEGEGASRRVDVDSCDVDSATLDVVRAFFDGDDGVCAEADRALGGSLCGWLFATSENVPWGQLSATFSKMAKNSNGIIFFNSVISIIIDNDFKNHIIINENEYCIY